MLKTILFDIGGTLIDNESWKSTVDRAAYKAMIDFGFNIGAEEFAEAFSRAVNDYDQVNNKSQKMHGGMDFVMRRLGKYLGISLSEEQEKLFKDKMERHRLDNIKLLDSADAILSDMANKYDMYVVSRGEGRIVRAMLKRLGIDSYFKDIFITGEMQADKESGRMFRLVIEKTHIEPKETVMIGNELEADGACMQFGIPFCFIDRLGVNPDKGYTFRIGNLDSINNILNFLNENIEMKCKLCNVNVVVNEIFCERCKGVFKSGILSNPEKYALVKELSLYLKWELNDTIENIMIGPILVRNEWLKKFPVTEKEIVEFYENSRNYIFDLAIAHLSDDWSKQDNEINNYALVENYETVLDYGCGLANSVFTLAGKGCRATCVDISDSLLNYVRWYASRKGINVEISKSIDTKRDFDFVICTDVLEHVPRPIDMLSKLANLVENGGAIALTTRFFREEHILHPMHLATNSSAEQAISTCLNDYGFVLDKNGSRGLQIWKKTK